MFAFVLAAALPLFAPDRFTVLNIAPCSVGEEKKLASEMIEYRNRTGNDIVLYSLSLHPSGRPAMDNAMMRIGSYRTLKKELEGSGVILGGLDPVDSRSLAEGRGRGRVVDALDHAGG